MSSMSSSSSLSSLSSLSPPSPSPIPSLSSPSLSPPPTPSPSPSSSCLDTTAPSGENDDKYLDEKPLCFKSLQEPCNKNNAEDSSKINEDDKNDDLKITTQFIYGVYLAPYFSILNKKQMEQFLIELQDPNAPACEKLASYKDIIKQERERFLEWICTKWESGLKNRRLTVVPCVEDYANSACTFTINYMKMHYNYNYLLKSTIDYTTDGFMFGLLMPGVVEMTHCRRIYTAEMQYEIDLPKISITDVEPKISFTDGVYSPPKTKSPFVDDAFCRMLSKQHNIDVNICLSSIKHTMNVEKPNGLWIIPISVEIDTNDNRKTVYIGGALDAAMFTEGQKCLYYLRKEIKRKFRKRLSTTELPDDDVPNNNCKYNYDKWTLTLNKKNGDVAKSFNVLIRSKPHIQMTADESNDGLLETVLIPKVEYQPEFGYEKIHEEQLVEYWLDTYFRNPKCDFVTVSVQYNMDIMMVKPKSGKNKDEFPDDKKQLYLQRLYRTIDRCTQLNKGDYIMFHNPKKSSQVELHQANMYGYKLWNTIAILQDSEVRESLTWDPIDTEVLCPIHEHFKIAPGMFRPNFTELNIKPLVGNNKKEAEHDVQVDTEKNKKRKLMINVKHKAKRSSNGENQL